MAITLISNNSGGNTTIKMSGIARYSLCLYKELKKKGDVQFFETPPAPWWSFYIGKIVRRDIETVLRGIPLTFPKLLPSGKNTLLHCTSQTLAIPLLYHKGKTLITVHDLIPVATKEETSPSEKFLYFFILMGLKKADHIIADSEYTKKDIIKYADIPAEKITVIHLGIDHKLFYDKKKKKEKNTILYVGSEQKRKNVELIIKALPLIKKEIPSIKFVKIGQAQDNKNRQKLMELAKEYGVDNHIIWKDYVEDISEEYNKAGIFVFPSLYEGFGFPVLEAMACGCPVICSNNTSIPELAGDAALYCDPTSEQDIAEKIVKMMKDKKMQAMFRKRGLAQAKKFTWEKCAEETVKAYTKCLS